MKICFISFTTNLLSTFCMHGTPVIVKKRTNDFQNIDLIQITNQCIMVDKCTELRNKTCGFIPRFVCDYVKWLDNTLYLSEPFYIFKKYICHSILSKIYLSKIHMAFILQLHNYIVYMKFLFIHLHIYI